MCLCPNPLSFHDPMQHLYGPRTTICDYELTRKRAHHLPTVAEAQEDAAGVDSSRYAGIHSTIIMGIKAYRFIGIVVGIAVGAAFYSMGRKLVVDKQMRLSRQNRKE